MKTYLAAILLSLFLTSCAAYYPVQDPVSPQAQTSQTATPESTEEDPTAAESAATAGSILLDILSIIPF